MCRNELPARQRHLFGVPPPTRLSVSPPHATWRPALKAMLEQWVIDKLKPLKGEKLIILADPQRMIRIGAQAVDGWARDNGFTVLFCSGNLALREMYENLRNDTAAKIILVDRTREKARLPLFYPDIEARCKPRARLTITLKDFLV